MAKIVGGIGSSHVPSIGKAYDMGQQDEPDWKPLFDAYKPVQEWLAALRPDIAIVIYNDHGGSFFFDHYPTFAVGAADSYGIADEGWGTRPLPPMKGDAAFSWHLCEQLIYGEFDITVCQELDVEHGFLVPMHMCFPHEPDWPVATVPVAVNVIQHPIPTALRCYKLGQALRRAVEASERDLRVVIFGTGGLSHQLNGSRFGHINSDWDEAFLDKVESDPMALTKLTHQEIMEQAGAEAVEVIMWLTMRGALSDKATLVHRNYYAPMATGMGLLAFEDAA